MRIIRRSERARDAARVWKESYCSPNGKWYPCYGENKKEIYEKLCKLGTNPDPDEVDRVIDDPSWTKVWCNECRNYVEEAIEIGEKPGYDSETATVCTDCLKSAWVLVGGKT